VPEERDELIASIATELRVVPPLDRALDARIMAEIAALPAHAPGGLAAAARWLRRPLTLRVSPLAGLAAAAGLGAIIWISVPRAGEAPVSLTAPAAEAAVAAPGVLLARHGEPFVQFVLVAPGAKSVALVGDFNDWDAAVTPLRRATGGAWSTAVKLPAGRHRYAFVVDGVRWIADPAAPPAPDDDFGSPGSVVTVGA
jgi:hypothetical protein